VEEIGAQAFYGCSSLTSVTIPDSVKNIGGWAFYDCAGLIAATVPDALIGSEMVGGAFWPDVRILGSSGSPPSGRS
jgi:hypothetical protein